MRVSPAETLDAFAATNLVGYAERDALKRALSLTLPKTPDEKARFDQCFDRFFDVETIESKPEADEGQPKQAASDLGQMLQSGDNTALSLAMAEAGRDAGVSKIQIFTQKGLFTRRVMERMGLDALNAEIAELRDGNLTDIELAQSLTGARDRLRGQVRDLVEREFMLHADHDGKRLREDLLRRVKLSNVDRVIFAT